MNQNYEPVIGLEIHIQLKTKSKMFSNAPNEVWKAEPNSLVNPVELGLPGALPVPNETAIKWTQQFGYCLSCTIQTKSKFDRKNYFYPDLPKGYQISQYDEPFCENGFLEIVNSADPSVQKRIRIRRVHLEEDTGKSMHKDGFTYLDYNKCGIPLVELVTEPDFSSCEECSEFSKMVQAAARILNISDADMEKGQMRLEANVSVRPKGQTELPNYRIELKNINSFKFMRDAINYEIRRQTELLEKGETLTQETRGWNSDKGKSFLQRRKEHAHDYRYFPEPDIPPFEFSNEYIAKITKDLPKMPWIIEKELVAQNVRPDYAKVISYDEAKRVTFLQLSTKNLTKPAELAKIIANTKDLGQVEAMLKKGREVAKKSTLSDGELEKIIQKVLAENSNAIKDYKAGKTNTLQFLVGQVMKQSKGQVEPQKVLEKIKTNLKILYLYPKLSIFTFFKNNSA